MPDQDDITISIKNNVVTIEVNPKGSFDIEEDGERYLVDICNFTSENNGTLYVLEQDDNDETIDSLNDHFDYLQIGYKGKLKDVFARRRIIINDFEKYQEKGLEIKEKEDGEHKIELVNFAGFKKKGYKIFDYQKPSIALMNEIPNTANFSIPGAGKTIMALAGFFKLQKMGKVKQLFVISPRPSFGPWKELYEEITGKKIDKYVKQYAGTIKQREKILPSLKKYDIVLCTFETATNDMMTIGGKDDPGLRSYFRNKMDGNVLLLLDEAHHIKRIDRETDSGNRSTSESMIQLGKEVRRRCILTGTPMPHEWDDLWTQITFLWPFNEPLGTRRQFQRKIRNLTEDELADEVSEIMEFMWTRVSHERVKDDLPGTNLVRKSVPMDKEQDDIYTMIESRRDRLPARGSTVAKIREWRKARIMRLMQACTNPRLIIENDPAFNTKGILKPTNAEDRKIRNKILAYKKAVPTKLKKVAAHAIRISEKGNNVIVFTQFRGNVHLLCKLLIDKGKDPLWVTGEIEPEGQEKIVKHFKQSAVTRKKQGQILIATAGTLSESVSLHKYGKHHVCNNIIFLERSYDAGKYMQALHRIYRIGSDKKKICNWYVYMSTPALKSGVTNTIDTRIDEVLEARIERLYGLLDDELILKPFSLDSSDKDDGEFGEDENQDDIQNTLSGL